MATPIDFTLRISAVDKQLYSGKVLSVTVPGVEGEMTILAHHEPFVTLLRKGTIVIKTTEQSGSLSFPVEGGVLETSANQMTILI